MPLPSERAVQTKPASQRALDTARFWNRKGHYYLGLYFLFFVWLFAFTGLLLNHGQWKFAEFWPNRKVTQWERAVNVPPAGTELDRARDLMTQLGIRGEIEWTAATPDSTRWEFRVNRPGQNFTVKVSAGQTRAQVEKTEVNGWGILRVLHTFTGVRAADSRNQRDWLLTTVWALAMDAVAAGLVLMVLSGLWLWWGLPSKRKLGALSLLLGVVTCGWLVVGLRWFY
jgi:hypothetical protein